MQEKGDHNWLKQGSTSSGEVRKIYDDWAGSYNETLEDWDYRAPTQAADMLRKAIPVGSELLDVGCGTGLTGLALRFAGFVGPIDGIDLSATSLREAESHDIYRALTAVDLQALPLPIVDDTYDALLCIGVLTYIPNGENVLREFARCVRSGGQILVTQRDDLFHVRDDSAMFERLSDVVDDIKISEPLPYLPSNPDFGDEIKVIYSKMTVS